MISGSDTPVPKPGVLDRPALIAKVNIGQPIPLAKSISPLESHHRRRQPSLPRESCPGYARSGPRSIRLCHPRSRRPPPERPPLPFPPKKNFWKRDVCFGHSGSEKSFGWNPAESKVLASQCKRTASGKRCVDEFTTIHEGSLCARVDMLHKAKHSAVPCGAIPVHNHFSKHLDNRKQ
jgi:hypothetical protein